MKAHHDTLPDEIICNILCFLNVRDVVKLRVVSKRFRDISYDPSIWRTLYANATLPRLPGPFPTQSVRFLEDTLVRSARLAQTWTTQATQDTFNAEIPVKWRKTPPRILHGRWLLDGSPSDNIVSLDLETGSRQVLWTQEDSIISWDACSVTSIAGQLVYVIIELIDESTASSFSPKTLVKLLEFRVDTDTGRLDRCVFVAVPSSEEDFAHVSLASGKSPFIYLRRERLIFDTRSRAIFEFPEFSTEQGVILPEPSETPPRQVSLTNTHIIVLNPLSQAYVTGRTLMQVFTPPVDPPQSNLGMNTLRLSHESVVEGWFQQFSLIRNSVIDPVTGSTHLRYLCRRNLDRDTLLFHCIDLTLSKPLTDSIVPISTDTHEVFNIRTRIVGSPTIITPGKISLDASDDGHVRGFCWMKHPGAAVLKFTIDATQDRCSAVLGEFSLSEGKPIADLYKSTVWDSLCFDGVRGRVWYTVEIGHAVVRVIDIT